MIDLGGVRPGPLLLRQDAYCTTADVHDAK
jgi:hypothetical protein